MKPLALFLFDYTTTIAKPWREAGFETISVDIEHPLRERDSAHISPRDKYFKSRKLLPKPRFPHVFSRGGGVMSKARSFSESRSGIRFIANTVGEALFGLGQNTLSALAALALAGGL